MKTISVCVGSSCHLKGSYFIIKSFQELLKKFNLEKEYELKAEFCCGNCKNPVSVKVDGKLFSVDKNKVEDFFKENIMRG